MLHATVVPEGQRAWLPLHPTMKLWVVCRVQDSISRMALLSVFDRSTMWVVNAELQNSNLRLVSGWATTRGCARSMPFTIAPIDGVKGG
jgi:hypothetical protein